MKWGKTISCQRGKPAFLAARLLFTVATVFCAACEHQNPLNPESPYVAGPTGNFRTISDAIAAAPAGETVRVQGATYGERLVITKSVKLAANQAVLDGQSLGTQGWGIEIRVDGVEISGFVVQNFERGIVIRNASGARIHDNEVRNNRSTQPPPTNSGLTWYDGIVLETVRTTEVVNNFVHDNGGVGLLVTGLGEDLTIRGNRFMDNGAQDCAYNGAGLSIIQARRVTISDNDIVRNGWGISLYSVPNGGNRITGNRVRENGRAGIAVYESGNRIDGNDARSNGLLNFPPTFGFDLVNHGTSLGDFSNQWENNSGTFATNVQAGLPPGTSRRC